MTHFILQLVATCVPVAEEAGRIIRNAFKDSNMHRDAEEEHYQTEAARLSQQFIMPTLHQKFSGITLIAKEKNYESHIFDEYEHHSFDKVDHSILKKYVPPRLRNVSQSQVTAWIDPLDGISEFQEGLMDQVTVLIGIAVGVEPVAGIIHQPFYDFQSEIDAGRTVWGITEIGAFGFSKRKLPTDKWIVTTSRNSDRLNEESVSSSNIDEIIYAGGSGYKTLLLLESKAHALILVSPKNHRWDICASEAVLQAAGGKLTDIFGDRYNYDKNTDCLNSKGILATSKREYHDLFSSIIPDSVRNGLA